MNLPAQSQGEGVRDPDKPKSLVHLQIRQNFGHSLSVRPFTELSDRGGFEIARAVASRHVNPYWWIGLITGILLVLLAFWVSGSDRVYALQRRTYLILFWVGFFALFKGHHANRIGVRGAARGEAG